MAHLRTQLRNRAIADLTGLTTTGSNVFASRVYPMESGNIPGLCIYTREETVTPATIAAPRLQMRELQLVIDGYAVATSNLDSTLDQIALEVEEAMAGDVTLNSLAKTIVLQSVDADYSDEGERPAGMVRLLYVIEYAALENDLETAQ